MILYTLSVSSNDLGSLKFFYCHQSLFTGTKSFILSMIVFSSALKKHYIGGDSYLLSNLSSLSLKQLKLTASKYCPFQPITYHRQPHSFKMCLLVRDFHFIPLSNQSEIWDLKVNPQISICFYLLPILIFISICKRYRSSLNINRYFHLQFHINPTVR